MLSDDNIVTEVPRTKFSIVGEPHFELSSKQDICDNNVKVKEPRNTRIVNNQRT